MARRIRARAAGSSTWPERTTSRSQRLRQILAPLGLEQAGVSEATHRGLGTRLPTEQGLTNYYVNLHRDWSWGEEENQAAMNELRALLGGSLPAWAARWCRAPAPGGWPTICTQRPMPR